MKSGQSLSVDETANSTVAQSGGNAQQTKSDNQSSPHSSESLVPPQIVPEAAIDGECLSSQSQDAVLKAPNEGKKDTKKYNGKRRPGYQSWANMKTRCNNRKSDYFEDYGGRGITYDPAWETFPQFILDMGEPPEPQHTIDRIDPNGNYEKSNCRWASKKEQTQNRRNTLRVKYRGEMRVLAEVAEEHGISPGTLSSRIKKGMSIEDALRTPAKWGGNRTIGISTSENNSWPSTLAAVSKNALEADYQEERIANPSLTRPAHFLTIARRHEMHWGEQYDCCPDDELPPDVADKVKNLEIAKAEAVRLLSLLDRTDN